MVIVDYKKNRIPSISKMRVGVMPSDYEELASYDQNQEKEDGYDSSAFFLEEIQVPSYTLVETSWGRGRSFLLVHRKSGSCRIYQASYSA